MKQERSPRVRSLKNSKAACAAGTLPGLVAPRTGPAVSAILTTPGTRSAALVATYLLDIVLLLTAAVIVVPVFRAIGLGATFAVAENLEASLDLASEVLLKESGDLGKTGALLETFRREYYEHIDTEADNEARDSIRD